MHRKNTQKNTSRRLHCIAALIFCLPVLSGAQVNTALDFNGTSDHIVLTTTTATSLINGYTLEAWANPTTSSLAHRIISNFQAAPSRGFGFGIRNTSWRHTTFGIKDYDCVAGSMTTGTWTHIAVTLDSANTATFYRDGSLLTSIPHAVIGRESTHTLNIGRNPIDTEFWQGSIDEVRIWDHVRSAQQISQHWDRTLIGTETGLIGYYPFSEGSGTATTDASANSGDGTLFGCSWISGPPLQAPFTQAGAAWMHLP